MRAVSSVFLVLMAMLTASTGQAGGADEPATHDVSIQGGLLAAAYVLPYVEVEVGDSVVWHHDGADPFARHSATADDGSFDTKTLGRGRASAPILFNVTGTFTYFCTVHPTTMHGVIVVV